MTLSETSQSPIDLHFALFIGRFGGGAEVSAAADLLSRAVRQGHLCLDLSQSPPEAASWPSPARWREILARSRAVGSPGDAAATPLVLDHAGRLYLRRFYEYETALAAAIRRRASGNPGAGEGQDAAVTAALREKLTLISGGPGTGKTTTVRRILAGWVSEPGGETLRIALCAPTGKAAARLEEALREGFATLEDAAVRERLATLPRAGTLDSLLGTRPGCATPRHHAANPLPLDALVVDEASMVALPQMARLLAALPENARLLLLGDRDQLASVAPGSVLADLVDAAGVPASPLAGSLVMLRRNYRFGNESGIHRLAQAIRAGDAPQTASLLAKGGDQISASPLPAPGGLAAALREPLLSGYGPALRERDPARALALLGEFRLLAAVRQGPCGVEELNLHAAALLHQAGLIRREGRFYAGLPLMITRNDPTVRLFNGDIGLILPEPGDPSGRLWAWFPDAEAGVRRIAPVRLPPHEPAYAMTIHKSQGSEFGEVHLILPERDLPLLTRELLYTGVTRARHRVHLWYDPALLAPAVERRAERLSGLRDAILNDSDSPR